MDTKSEIFQNLNGAIGEVQVVTINDNMVVFNNLTQNYPAFFHGNGPTKVNLIFKNLYLSNYSTYYTNLILNILFEVNLKPDR